MIDSASPLQANERNQLIDLLRGFAILGILIANLEGWIVFALPEEQADLLMTTVADKITSAFISIFVENKFITLFCFLFGYGFGIVIDRINAKRIPVVAFFLRRMVILLAIGLIHLGLWWGEILSTYALCGMLLLLFRNLPDHRLLIWGAVLLFFVAPLLQGLKLFFFVEDPSVIDQLYNQYLTALHSSELLNIVKYNYKMVDVLFIRDGSQFRDMADVLGKFLFGYFVMRRNLLSPSSYSRATMVNTQLFVMPVALFYIAEKSFIHFGQLEFTSPSWRLLIYLLDRCGILSLMIFYATSLTLLFYDGKLKTLSGVLCPVGMMSLTNYLTHTIFYVLFFYGFGWGMLGQFHLQWMIPLAMLIYSVQILFSNYWMNKMTYGPVEWIWRQATYGKSLPLSRQKK